MHSFFSRTPMPPAPRLPGVGNTGVQSVVGGGDRGHGGRYVRPTGHHSAQCRRHGETARQCAGGAGQRCGTCFFATQVKIGRRQTLLPDKTVVNIQLTRRLGFHALTKKYVVDDLTLGKRKSFTSVSSALVYLGRFRDVPLANAMVIKPASEMQVRLRIKLIAQKLPLPLRARRFFSRAWRLSSDWYIWPLK